MGSPERERLHLPHRDATCYGKRVQSSAHLSRAARACGASPPLSSGLKAGRANAARTTGRGMRPSAVTNQLCRLGLPAVFRSSKAGYISLGSGSSYRHQALGKPSLAAPPRAGRGADERRGSRVHRSSPPASGGAPSGEAQPKSIPVAKEVPAKVPLVLPASNPATQPKSSAASARGVAGVVCQSGTRCGSLESRNPARDGAVIAARRCEAVPGAGRNPSSGQGYSATG